MDSFWLNSAFYQAYCSLGNTGKNPAVGCILVNNHKVVGVGSTSKNGRPHAEENAIKMAGKEVAEIIVVSDTMVTDPDDPLMPMGKPEDGQHAMAMLLRLSGNRHRVWSSTALVYPPNGQGEHSLHGGWSADIWTESAVVEFDQLSQERLIELVSSESWKGKAGAYDLAGAASQDARLVDGEEVTVLGFAPSAISKLQSM